MSIYHHSEVAEDDIVSKEILCEIVAKFGYFVENT
jgi:hypothetical protein